MARAREGHQTIQREKRTGKTGEKKREKKKEKKGDREKMPRKTKEDSVMTRQSEGIGSHAQRPHSAIEREKQRPWRGMGKEEKKKMKMEFVGRSESAKETLCDGGDRRRHRCLRR